MTEPTEYDVSAFDRPAQKRWEQDSGRPWPTLFGSETFNEEGVRELLIGTGYPEEQLHFVRGPVEQTIPDEAPEHLALLRLDTDWYESTRHELEHLFPRLVPGGVLILDDYGHWDGARKAVDEFFAANPPLKPPGRGVGAVRAWKLDVPSGVVPPRSSWLPNPRTPGAFMGTAWVRPGGRTDPV